MALPPRRAVRERVERRTRRSTASAACCYLRWERSFWYSADIVSMKSMAALYCTE
jgi:hypothetical protein